MGIDLPPDELEKLGLPRGSKRKPTKSSKSLKAVKVPESAVIAGCLKLLRARRWHAWRNNSGAVKSEDRFIRYGVKGSSDIVAVVPKSGRFAAIEAKRPYIKGVQAAGKLSDDQKAFLKAVRDANGVAVVIDDPMALGLFMDALEQDPWADVPIADEIIEL